MNGVHTGVQCTYTFAGAYMQLCSTYVYNEHTGNGRGAEGHVGTVRVPLFAKRCIILSAMSGISNTFANPVRICSPESPTSLALQLTCNGVQKFANNVKIPLRTPTGITYLSTSSWRKQWLIKIGNTWTYYNLIFWKYFYKCERWIEL